jgi:hypothetical protein
MQHRASALALLKRSPQLLGGGIAVALLTSYIVGWAAGTTPQHAADFSSTYTAAVIVRSGDIGHMYAAQEQARVGAEVLAPGQLALPYSEMPAGAVLAVPLTLLPLSLAFRVWAALQLMLVVVAAVIAARAAPSMRPVTARRLLLPIAIAVAGAGTANLIDVGQWTGVNALGLALAYRSWRNGSYAGGSIWLTLTALMAKPHLAVGLFIFLLGWGNRRAIVAAVVTGAAVLLSFVAIVGVSGLRDAVMLSAGYSARGGTTLLSLASMWYDDTAATFAIGLMACAAALVLCFLIGRRARDPRWFGAALAAAAALSLLATPHAFLYDQVMLVPAVAWWLVSLGSQPAAARIRSRLTVALLWIVVPRLLVAFPAVTPFVLRFGELYAWSLLALAGAFWFLAPGLRDAARRRGARLQLRRSTA